MNKSETITEIAKALSKFQSEVSDPERTKENAFLKAKYVTLDSLLQAVRPVLADNGLSFLQIPSTAKDGVGSVVTYARRYSLSSILGVAWDEDDDAQSNNETELTKQILHEVTELVKVKGVQNETVASYIKTTFNKSSSKLLDLTELKQVKSWLMSL